MSTTHARTATEATTSRALEPVPPTLNVDAWPSAALALLAVRFAQGWIFCGGGSRRFIYAPNKLDPNSTVWMANKLQSAMPGAILGADRAVDINVSDPRRR